MAKKVILPTHWRTIVERIDEGDCVPFLGAGVNAKSNDYEGLPLGGEVALRMVEMMIDAQVKDLTDAIRHENLEQYRQRADKSLNELEEILQAMPQIDKKSIMATIKSFFSEGEQPNLAHVITDKKLEDYKELTRVALQDLARVSLRFRSEHDLPGFVNQLKAMIPDVGRKPSRLLKTLAALPFQLIITTNYDRLMERALELFSADSVKDAVGLTAKLKEGKTLLSRFLWGEMSPAVKQAAEMQGIPDAELKRAIAEELNRLIQDFSLDVLEEDKPNATPEEITKLTREKPQTLKSVRLNRLLLEKSYAQEIKPHDKPYTPIIQPLKGFQGREQNVKRRELADADGLIIYKLHGTFPDGDPDKETRPLITEEDYIEFLTYVGGNSENIDPLIRAQLTNSTLLFLGYSLEDWNFRALFKGLIEKLGESERRMSFAIQKDPSEFWVDFWEKKQVIIYNLDLYEFAAELEERYRDYLKKKKSA